MNQLRCDTAYEWIVRDLDEGLEGDQSTLLDVHLRECPACTRLKVETAALLSRLPEDTPPEPDEGFWIRYRSSLNARLQEKAASRRLFWSFGWKAVAVGVSASLVALLIVLGGPFHSEPQEQWQNTAKIPGIVKEFSDMYGPVPDEIPNGSTSKDLPLTKADSRVLLAGPDLMTWYDVDDETNAWSF